MEKLTISKLAKLAGVGVETIRFYQRKDLLREPKALGAFRIYSQEDAQKIVFIKRAQDLGFTLEEIGWIRQFLGFGFTIAGAALGGVLIARLGIARSMLIFGVLQAASNLGWVWLDHAGKDRAVHIVKNGAKGLVYLALAVTAGTFAVGGSSSSSGSTTSLTAGLLSTPGGVFLVVAIGIVLIAIAGYLVVKGVTRRFERDLSMPGGTAGRGVRILGTVGYIARGVAMAGVGVLFLFAAATNDPEKSSGLDGALRTIADLPAGKILLVLVGAGWIAYGVYAFFRARYTRL
jgi:hypothetical protein